ncbi:hypothetical protein GLAREA_07543 [Glarea lozoyensis ATCC 20868]|uniref:Uncharacterized protein n=1 Tax=Glarea lozoyensis (strain ATCC 20868 / MF5171) TaxID=1116229 RepID=S3D3P9_GLAL2|nr:uncharacterized protein GLAREA_07543 [Glarea lozoyensis ATCC 20868]EPE32410.1 hypothetical protein GLAREA_07543 [Glarea lozoyensis ATCC 20868]
MNLRKNPKNTPKSAENDEMRGLRKIAQFETEEDATSTQVNVFEQNSFGLADADAPAHSSAGIQSSRKRKAGGTIALSGGQKRANVALAPTRPSRKAKRPTNQYDIMMSELGSMNAMLRSSLGEGSNRLYPVGYESQSERYGADITFEAIKSSVANGESVGNYSPEILEQLGFSNPGSNQEEDYEMGVNGREIQDGEESDPDDFLFSIPKDPSQTTPGYSAWKETNPESLDARKGTSK